VLHTLGMFMNELGEGCYPSVADICRYSGLDKKTVLKHLAGARDAGWIAVAQHGYRGQKWKRQEYAARWPDRDLVAPCAPDDAGEGGVSAPPPSVAEKVVESTVKGGGTEGSKVVEHVHQDKTSPENIPNTSPVEREREREAEERKSVERWVKDTHRHWPSYVSDSAPKALAAAFGLSAEERAAAAERMADYVASAKVGGRTVICTFAVYLAEKRWEKLPPPQAKPKAPDDYAPPFGPVWGAFIVGSLIASNVVPVMALYRQARLGRGYRFGERWHGLKAAMEAVPVGSATFEAWHEEFRRRDWPWLPDPGGQQVVYFPAGGPERIGEFEAAVRGEDDAGGREAAE
jgi:hypothetical protein